MATIFLPHIKNIYTETMLCKHEQINVIPIKTLVGNKATCCRFGLGSHETQ
jgi:hypothetical protein